VLVRQNNIIWINIYILHSVIEVVLTHRLIDLIPGIVQKIKSEVHVVILDVLFIIFLVKNDFSVVLGDRSSHSMVVHLAQINHLLIFFLFFFPWLNTKLLDLFKRQFWNSNNIIRLTVIFSIVSSIMFIFNQYSYTHDFLLADNRHYSFYYFSKIYNNTTLRNLLLSYTSLITSLVINDNPNLLKSTYIHSWLICTTLVLVPAKLFEFRYLTLPMLTFVLIIHSNYPSWRDLYERLVNKYNVAWMILVNAVTIVVFLYRPFKNNFMELTPMSRFMW
jgi:alpha-1,2-glucosyltransferase